MRASQQRLLETEFPAPVLDLFFVLTSSVTYDERFACLVGSRSDVNICVIMYQ